MSIALLQYHTQALLDEIHAGQHHNHILPFSSRLYHFRTVFAKYSVAPAPKPPSSVAKATAGIARIDSPLWHQELTLLERVLVRNKNQSRNTIFYRHVVDVRRKCRMLASYWHIDRTLIAYAASLLPKSSTPVASGAQMYCTNTVACPLARLLARCS